MWKMNPIRLRFGTGPSEGYHGPNVWETSVSTLI
jgi:hypothetical protein